MNNNDFDFSDYDDEYTEPATILPKKKEKEQPEETFNFSDYYEEPEERKVGPIEAQYLRKRKTFPVDEDTINRRKDIFTFRSPEQEQKPHEYESLEKTPEQIKKMSIDEKLQYIDDLKTHREFTKSNVAKGIASGITAGLSEKVDLLKLGETEEEQFSGNIGKAIGIGLPIGYAIKALSLPLRLLPEAAKWTYRILQTGIAGTAVGGYEAAREAIAGEELDPYTIGTHAAIGAGADILLRGGIGIYRWFKNLKPAQQAKFLASGELPEDLSIADYKKYQDVVVPEIHKAAAEDYERALAAATKANDTKFNQKMANVKAEHERQLADLAKHEAEYAEQAPRAKKEYENKLNQVKAEHEAEMTNIQKQNDAAMAEFDQQKEIYEAAKRRQDIVEQAIQPKESEAASLEGRVKEGGEQLPIKPEAPPKQTPVQEEVGNIIYPERIANKTEAGTKNIKAVRATDDADYKVVKNLYEVSDQLNEGVISEHPQLANELRAWIEDWSQMPNQTPIEQQRLASAKRLLNALLEKDEAGIAIGFSEVSNKVILDQAKVLRNSLSYDFSHGNPEGILKPFIDALQDAAESAAMVAGNTEAVAANKAARTAYRKWAETYQNPFIRSLRNTKNKNPTKSFDKSLNIDDFNKLNDVLSRSYSGQQLADQTRRELVDKYVGKFLKETGRFDKEGFNAALRDLKPILKPGEEQSIRQAVNQSQKRPVIIAEKVEVPKQPSAPKLKQGPETVRIPSYKQPFRQHKAPEVVKIPAKPEVKPTAAMKEAAKRMKITPEEAIAQTNSVTGLRNLKKSLVGSPSGQQIYRDIGKRKIREILYEGKVKHEFTGEELYRVINKADNFNVISEIIGEDAAVDLLESAKSIADKRATVESIKKVAKKFATVKAALMFGIL